MSPWRFLALHYMYVYRARSVLDYGCGKKQLEETVNLALKHLSLRPLIFYNYDPGIPECAQLPEEPVDVTICTDVMEHIEPELLNNNIDAIYNITLKLVLFVTNLQDSCCDYLNGENIHKSKHTHEWWFNKMSKWDWKINVIFSGGIYSVMTCEKKWKDGMRYTKKRLDIKNE